jgi:alpha-glucoside transport system permease protein
MDSRLVTAVIVVVGVPAVLVGYIWATEQVLKLFSERLKPRIRPWLWLAPALAFLGIFLVYPTIGTIIRSLYSKGNILGQNTKFIGLDNYAWFFSDDRSLSALKNNLLWLVLLTLITVGVGLLIAILADKVRYESFAKSIIFLPLAISMVAAAVIWKFMYDYQPAGAAQTGTLNAVIGLVGIGPVGWAITGDFSLTTIMLIIVMAWMWTGFAMVILSAGLKGINGELLEAARVDGANEWQVFKGIVFPLLLPTIAVVATTIIITALKAFDIVYATTNGNYDTEVIANLMYKEMFTNSNFSRASAIAVILLLAIIPVMLFNVRRFRAQEAIR